MEFGQFLVETASEDAWDKDVVKRVFKVTNSKQVSTAIHTPSYIVGLLQDTTRTITQLQYVEWPQHSCPSTCTPIIDLIETVERVQRKTGNGPITVHCRYCIRFKALLFILFRIVMVLGVPEHSVH